MANTYQISIRLSLFDGTVATPIKTQGGYARDLGRAMRKETAAADPAKHNK